PRLPGPAHELGEAARGDRRQPGPRLGESDRPLSFLREAEEPAPRGGGRRERGARRRQRRRSAAAGAGIEPPLRKPNPSPEEDRTVDRFQRILVGMTDTEADSGLLRYAALVARVCGTQRVCFAHVLPTAGGGRADGEPVSDRDRALAALEAAVRAQFPEAANPQTAVEVLKGPLVDRLLGLAVEREADLVLVGRRLGRGGRRGLARRLA